METTISYLRTVCTGVLGVLLSLLSVVTSLPVPDPADSEVVERWRRNVVNSNVTTTSAPITTTISWLERATPYIYILPPILVGLPLLCCLCCCIKALPCCKSCCSDDDEGKQLTGSRTTSRVSPSRH